MPDSVAKYLNKTGLQTYNELLPLGDAAMQSYVDDWLDEHPEATTTVQPDSVTDAMLIQNGGVLSQVQEMQRMESITTGTFSQNATIFTLADVNVGDVIYYDLTAKAAFSGFIELMDAGYTRISYYGKGAKGAAQDNWQGTFVIPENFSYARANGNQNSTVTINKLYKVQSFGNAYNALSLNDTALKAEIKGASIEAYTIEVVPNIGSAVRISNGNIEDYSNYTTWATSPLLAIPEGTSAIESNMSAHGSSQIIGYALYDGSYTRVGGGQILEELTEILPTYKYIRLSNYSEVSDHSNLYVRFYVPNVAKKSCVCFGDSITWYDLHAYNWGKFSDEMAIGYETWLRRKLGLIVTNEGISGAVSTQICNTVLSKDLTNYDYMTLTAGANDERHNTTLGVVLDAGSTFDATTFCGAFQTAIEYALAQNPEMKIVLCTPIQGWIYEDGYDYVGHPSSGSIDEKWANAIKRIAEIYSLPVCDWYTVSGLNLMTRNVYYNDPEPPENTQYSLHPTPKGYVRMSEILVATMRKLYI